MIKKFDEFVNEGIISDYKKQSELANKEVSNGDKKFVLEVLAKLKEVDMPFAFTCKTCDIISNTVKEDKYANLRDKVYKIDEIEDKIEDIHISERSVLRIFGEKSEWIDGEYKNIWKSIYKWFNDAYDKKDLTFNGKIKVEKLLEMKNDIKKGLF